MKNKFLYIYMMLIAMSFAACDDYFDVNTDPNAATEPPINGLLASTTQRSAINTYNAGTFTSFFVQYQASPNQGSPTDTYDEVDYSGTWGSFYDVMTDLYDMRELGAKQGAKEHEGVAKILMAYNLATVIDIWGSVPYTEAFSGEVVTPDYDSDETLYQTVLQLLDQGIADLGAGSSSVRLAADSDFIHGGDVDAWLKTAHALKARYLNHFSKTSGYNATEVLSNVDKAYTANADNAEVTRFQVRNPWAQVARNNANLLLDGWLSEQFIDALNGTTFGVEDPRLPLITNPLADGSYVGTPNGAGRRGDGTTAEECYLIEGKFYSATNSPLMMVTFAEIKMIEAEAAFRNNNKDRALNAFLAGIREHMNKMGVASTDTDAYIAAAYPGLTAGTLTLTNIMREKYVVMFLNPESWVDARRYDYQYQDFTLPQNANLNEFIRRVQYPSTELTRNSANTPQVSLTDRIFWDK